MKKLFFFVNFERRVECDIVIEFRFDETQIFEFQSFFARENKIVFRNNFEILRLWKNENDTNSIEKFNWFQCKFRNRFWNKFIIEIFFEFFVELKKSTRKSKMNRNLIDRWKVWFEFICCWYTNWKIKWLITIDKINWRIKWTINWNWKKYWIVNDQNIKWTSILLYIVS